MSRWEGVKRLVERKTTHAKTPGRKGSPSNPCGLPLRFFVTLCLCVKLLFCCTGFIGSRYRFLIGTVCALEPRRGEITKPRLKAWVNGTQTDAHVLKVRDNPFQCHTYRPSQARPPASAAALRCRQTRDLSRFLGCGDFAAQLARNFHDLFHQLGVRFRVGRAAIHKGTVFHTHAHMAAQQNRLG